MSPESIGGNVPGTTNDPGDRIRRSVGGLECLRPVAERVLTLRELNRATLARQLLLQRTRLSPTAVIERLVGMQAQSPQAPYVGIWTRTTGFRRGSLERLLRQSTIVRATATRQTLHLVTRRDYALIRAAFPWETKQAKQLAPSVRALAARGPVTSAEALAHLESEYGLAGVDARRAWQTARLAAHIVHAPRDGPLAAAQRATVCRNRGTGGARPGRGARRDLPPLPRGLRPFDAPRHRSLEHDPRGRDRRCAGAARAAAPLPRRAGPRAPRRPTSAAAGRRDPGARTLPAEVGQRPARVGRPHARAPGGATGRR